MAAGEIIATIKLHTGSVGGIEPGDLIKHLEDKLKEELHKDWWKVWGVLDIKLDYNSWQKKVDDGNDNTTSSAP